MTHNNNSSSENGSGVVRIGRKGRRKFAFGDSGQPFEVDVVVVFQQWVCIDEQFRERSEDRSIAISDMPLYHQTAREFVASLCGAVTTTPGGTPTPDVSTAEALDFIARLREQYDEVAVFFRPRSREERDSPDTSEVELQFSAEEN